MSHLTRKSNARRGAFARGTLGRRAFLGSAGAACTLPFLDPILASADDASPSRLLIVHRPCGTVLEDFFPTSNDPTNFEMSPILASVAPFKEDMVILGNVTCPRDTAWFGDQHSAGIIAMMSGRRFMSIPGTDASTDPNAKNIVSADITIDQLLMNQSPYFQGTAIPSIQSTAFRPGSVGLPSFKVMSYSGPNEALFPESRADLLFDRFFGGSLAGLSEEEIARIRAERGSILDFMSADLARLQTIVPASELPKLEAHLEGIRGLEMALDSANAGANCEPPTLQALPNVPDGITVDEAQHFAVATNQLNLIRSAFSCDITRVATFSYAHGNSDLRFSNIVDDFGKNTGHHSISHDTTAIPQQGVIDRLYTEHLSNFLADLKAIPEGDGNLLDHTLVVFLNECAIGNTHSIEQMPVVLFGGKCRGLVGGRYLDFGGRYMNDIWAAVAQAYGVELPDGRFADPDWGQGAVSGLYA
jgi:hypothetical protein